ncbi:MAG: helix-turn-helix domain-containing protein [Rhizomicrobium sp.]
MTDADVILACEMARQGASDREIARALSRTPATITRMLNAIAKGSFRRGFTMPPSWTPAVLAMVAAEKLAIVRGKSREIIGRESA